MLVRCRWIVVGTLVLGVVLGASRADAQSVIIACKNNVNGNVRIVASASDCKNPETSIIWNQQGSQGPTGAVGPTGSIGPIGPLGPTGAVAVADPPCFSNTNRYKDCGNGTVTDGLTGLVWLQQSRCLGFADWATGNATAAALKSGQCGLTDKSVAGQWRLPTVAEWQTTSARAIALACHDNDITPALTNDAGTGCYFDGASSSLLGVPAGLFPTGALFWAGNSVDANPLQAWVWYSYNGVMFDVVSKFGVNTGITFPIGIWPVRRVP